MVLFQNRNTSRLQFELGKKNDYRWHRKGLHAVNFSVWHGQLVSGFSKNMKFQCFTMIYHNSLFIMMYHDLSLSILTYHDLSWFMFRSYFPLQSLYHNSDEQRSKSLSHSIIPVGLVRDSSIGLLWSPMPNILGSIIPQLIINQEGFWTLLRFQPNIKTHRSVAGTGHSPPCNWARTSNMRCAPPRANYTGSSGPGKTILL